MSLKAKTLKKILIVEDDPLILNILQQQFMGHDFSVDTAVDGEQGLQKYFAEKPDAVILDIVLPKKDGIQFLSELRTKAPTDNIPVIVLTNSNDMNHLANAVNFKVAAYLSKSDEQLKNITHVVKQQLNLI